MTANGHDIFISYSSGDEPVARELRSMLDAAGYTCWMAPDDVVGTDPWAKQIIRAIETSRVMVVVISARSNASEHVGREVELASGRRRPVLPIRIERVEYDERLEYFLAGSQRVDAYAGAIAEHRDRILRRLSTIVPSPPTSERETDPAVVAPAPAPQAAEPTSSQALQPAATERVEPAAPQRPAAPAPASRPSLSVWARANSMLIGSAVTIAALVIVATGVLAFGQPQPSPSPSPEPTETGSATPGPTASPTPSPSPTLAPSQAPTTTFRDGLHKVGIDIQPGTYRLREPAAFCSFKRLRGMGGTAEETIVDEIVIGYALVTIKPTDVGFQSSDCGEWSADLSRVTPSRSMIDHDGIYIVGTDISPGTWRSTGGKDCYWARLKGFTRTTDEVLANDIVNVATTVTIRPDDVGFETVRCGSWRLK